MKYLGVGLFGLNLLGLSMLLCEWKRSSYLLVYSWKADLNFQPILLSCFYPHPRTSLLILERGKGKERNIGVREKHQLVASCTCPNQEPNPQPRLVP